MYSLGRLYQFPPLPAVDEAGFFVLIAALNIFPFESLPL